MVGKRQNMMLSPAPLQSSITLKSLSLSGRCIEEDNQLGSLSNPFPHLEEFIGGYSWEFRRVPVWMGGLNCLRILELRVMEASTQEVNLLGQLPSLVVLWLWTSHIPKERTILGTGLFPVLKRLQFWAEEDVGAYLGFEAGAMPNLRDLTISTSRVPNLRDLTISTSREHGAIPVGLEHLYRLETVYLSRALPRDAIVSSAFRDALFSAPKPPFRWPLILVDLLLCQDAF
ncbi:unnamed protein product [Triticum turgidum subsp. durum]|uniref:Disease resistance R13L4/SHOC-2-like LRR domain-containing protein n=1 Tax=Triticum turgidum subsp. durum TaxID=4567 RepID=A0A9R0R6G9_TRITD|nr:unnamed protein product [Triticum turgidum subsp. durum]